MEFAKMALCMMVPAVASNCLTLATEYRRFVAGGLDGGVYLASLKTTNTPDRVAVGSPQHVDGATSSPA